MAVAPGDVLGRFREQSKVLEFEFGYSGTEGRPSVNEEEICSIGKNVSSAATDSFRSISISGSDCVAMACGYCIIWFWDDYIII